MKFKGIVLSTDGVLCDVSEIRLEAWKQVASTLEVTPNDRDLSVFAQASNESCLELLCEKAGLELSETEKTLLIQQKREAYQQLLLTTPLILTAGVRETMDRLKQASFRLAIASPSTNTLSLLRSIGLYSYFDAVADGNDIENPLQEGQVFYAASRYLGLFPSDCIAVESRTHRIPELMNMGFFTVGLRTPTSVICSAQISRMLQLPDLLADIQAQRAFL